MISISSNFDAGAIEVANAASSADIQLNIRADSHAEFRQWFYFRLQGARGEPCTIRLLNAGACTYAGGWSGYSVVASYDRSTWFRVPTTYDGKIMAVTHTPERDSVYYAYFEPYSWERHLDLLGRAENSPLARVRRLGTTVEGRDLDCVTLGTPGADKRVVWIIARQHPGETMAEWFVEGMLDALLERANPIARSLLARTVFHVVPNMNPDGSVRGNLRTNAAGANLNREWSEPSIERSPEVALVRDAIHAAPPAVFLDVHGDEVLPYVFVAGNEMLPDFTPTQIAAQRLFCESFRRANPDFQTEHGYGVGKYSAEALKLASKYVGHTFRELSLTLELPFKDNANLPDPALGWDGARSARLGAAVLQPILAMLP